MQSQEFVYDDAPTGSRFLILNDLTQEFPTEPLKVVSAIEREASGGKKYPVLTLEAPDGSTYDVAAWPRDVKECIEEFGGKPTSWGKVRVARGSTRMKLVPAEKLTATEEDMS